MYQHPPASPEDNSIKHSCKKLDRCPTAALRIHSRFYPQTKDLLHDEELGKNRKLSCAKNIRVYEEGSNYRDYNSDIGAPMRHW